MISPSAYKITNSLFWPILIGMIFLFASWLCGVGLAYMDKKCDELDKDVMEMN